MKADDASFVSSSSLPQASSLASIPRDQWRALADRFRAIGFDGRYVASSLRVGERIDDALRAPMRTWSVRKRREPAALAMRMFVLGDPVDANDATIALGDFNALLNAGALIQKDQGVVSPFRLAIAFGHYFFADDLAHGGNAVMGPSATTSYLAIAARPQKHLARLLEIGCGAGTIAISLADRATYVVATDTNPRALVLAGINAQMNGVTNIEFRQGDLFEPVRDESFDLIVAQPPFVARTPSDVDAPFLFGGARGDELALRIFARIGDHVADNGRAVLLVDWPVVTGDEIDARIRKAIPEVDLDLLIVESPARNLEDQCTLHAAASHPSLGAPFANAAMAMRDHFDRMNVQSLKLAINIVARASAPPGFTHTIAARHFTDAPPSSIAIDRFVRARALIARGGDALLDARFRIPDAASFDERALEGEGGSASHVIVVRLPEDRLTPSMVVDIHAFANVERVHSALSFRLALASLDAADHSAFIRDVKDAILRGLLEIDEAP